MAILASNSIRIVIDENISWRLKKLLPSWDILPVNEIKQQERLTDFTIWQFAKTNQYTILTFDEDFWELQNLYSFPPKIIWLRTGNVNTKIIADLLSKRQDSITQFIDDDSLGIYELYV
jgi:predicted nuclease of predicted toxin-antitoxin system